MTKKKNSVNLKVVGSHSTKDGNLSEFSPDSVDDDWQQIPTWKEQGMKDFN